NKIEFLGNVAKEELRVLYQNANALIVTQEEDFGIAMAEAQACGTFVIAFQKGGAGEVIIDGKTGLFFNLQTSNSLKDAISAQSKLKWDISACRKNGLKFSKAAFINNFKKTIDDYVSQTH
ncbi:MAG: glycosyltransferase, partial [Candidatus Magasanikbacteria bacterium]|nr:glycosyltransferase [Candidatus Magasanikbacteria bacterium]